jgi:ATP-dependent Clp protease ATP-binding subunit ClpC
LYEKLTERGRRAISFAQDEARTLKHKRVGTVHILLGLLREEEGMAARVLECLDITVERVRAQVVRIVGSGEEVTSGEIPFSPRAKRVLAQAECEAEALGHNYIGTEHILLALVRIDEGIAARILLAFDAESWKIRNEVIRMIISPDGRRQPAKDPATCLVIRGIVDGELQTMLADAGSTVIVVSPTGSIPCSTPKEYEGRKGLAVWHTPARTEASEV